MEIGIVRRQGRTLTEVTYGLKLRPVGRGRQENESIPPGALKRVYHLRTIKPADRNETDRPPIPLHQLVIKPQRCLLDRSVFGIGGKGPQEINDHSPMPLDLYRKRFLGQYAPGGRTGGRNVSRTQ